MPPHETVSSFLTAVAKALARQGADPLQPEEFDLVVASDRHPPFDGPAVREAVREVLDMRGDASRDAFRPTDQRLLRRVQNDWLGALIACEQRLDAEPYLTNAVKDFRVTVFGRADAPFTDELDAGAWVESFGSTRLFVRNIEQPTVTSWGKENGIGYSAAVVADREPLTSLHRVVQMVMNVIGCDREYSTGHMLLDWIPFVEPVTTERPAGGRPTVVVKVNYPWVSSETVRWAYERAHWYDLKSDAYINTRTQRAVERWRPRVPRPRPGPSPAVDALMRFVNDRPGETWATRAKRWNEENPEHQYKDERSMKSAYYQARRTWGVK